MGVDYSVLCVVGYPVEVLSADGELEEDLWERLGLSTFSRGSGEPTEIVGREVLCVREEEGFQEFDIHTPEIDTVTAEVKWTFLESGFRLDEQPKVYVGMYVSY